MPWLINFYCKCLISAIYDQNWHQKPKFVHRVRNTNWPFYLTFFKQRALFLKKVLYIYWKFCLWLLYWTKWPLYKIFLTQSAGIPKVFCIIAIFYSIISCLIFSLNFPIGLIFFELGWIFEMGKFLFQFSKLANFSFIFLVRANFSNLNTGNQF